MACEIELSLEPAGPVEVGAEVSVHIRATSTEAAWCHAVRCVAGWETHGRGEKDSDRPFAKAAPGGDMMPGVPMEREFRFAVPLAGPVTYSGLRLSRRSLLSIDWQVRVWLDGQWEKDPERVVRLVVVPRSI
jgi:hypothetical protein